MSSDDEGIPERLRARPRWKGLPIPFTTWTDATGKPDFRKMSNARHTKAMAKRLCGQCGEPLLYWIVFHVGPTILQHRLVFEAGAHEECARYALTACPFLSREEWQRRPVEGEPSILSREMLAKIPEKPRAIGLAFVRSYETAPNEQGWLYALFPAPHHVEWWAYRDGRLAVTDDEPAITRVR